MITQSKRTKLEVLRIEDAPFILDLLNSPGWLQYIGDRGVKTLEDAENYVLNGPAKDFENLGYSLFKVSLNESGEAIGLCGLLKRDYLDYPDIGFAFLPDYTGKGYALEASEAVLSWAKEELGISKVLAITLPENKRSIGLLKKLGLRYEKMVQHPDKAMLCLYGN